MPRIVNENDVDWTTHGNGVSYGPRRRSLGAAAGGTQLGCSLIELPPGKRSWPMHWHAANEEAVYVLAGEGVLRSPAGDAPLRAGDYVAFPVGPDHAHQIENRSAAPLRYLAISTMREPDVSVYPESSKVGVFAGAAPGSRQPRTLEAFLPLAAACGYFDGEEP